MVGTREFHLFYQWKGIICNYLYQEEVFTASTEAEVRETIGKIVDAMRKAYNPWKYSFRVEAPNGAYWVVERKEDDAEKHLFTCTYYKRWNWQEETVKMNRRELTKAILNLEKESDGNPNGTAEQ